MSYLVYCTTCQEKISVNAKSCPNCGENQFYLYEIDKNKECPLCKGKGLYWSAQALRSRFFGYWKSGEVTCVLCNGSGKEKSLKDQRKKVN